MQKRKLKFIGLALLTLHFSYFSSQNLVPNPGFETVVSCPSGNGNITDCASWLNFGNSPDYYNGCATFPGMQVPTCQTGYQFAHSGVGMVGIVTWYNPMTTPNAREFFAAQLSSTLTIGNKYYMSFFINYSGYLYGWRQVAADKIGLKFSTVPTNSSNPFPLNNFAHLKTTSIYKDTINWMKISGSFIADSAYKYVVIGNFFNDINTDTSSYPGPSFGGMASYYYIDDACVTNDSMFNVNWATNIMTTSRDSYAILYPNPTSESIYISTPNYAKYYDIEIFDNTGELKKTLKLVNENQFDVSDLKNGIYVIKIKNSNFIETKKIVISK